MDQLYDSNLGCEENPLSPYELSSRVFRIRHSLATWTANLPPIMHIVELSDLDHVIDPGACPVQIRLRTVLTLRYHNARILAHKVVIQRACAQIDNVTEENKLDADAITDLARSSIPVLLDATSEIINIVAKLSAKKGVERGMLPSWWYTLYYGKFKYVVGEHCNKIDNELTENQLLMLQSYSSQRIFLSALTIASVSQLLIPVNLYKQHTKLV